MGKQRYAKVGVLGICIWFLVAACSAQMPQDPLSKDPAKQQDPAQKQDPTQQPPPSIITSGVVTLPEAPKEEERPQGKAGEIAASSAPLSGAQDRSDRACQITLRQLSRAYEADGRPKIDCSAGLCWWVFEATADVSQEAIATGWQPFLLFRSLAEPDIWREITGQSIAGASSGYQRFLFILRAETIRDGLSASALERSEIGAIPFLRHAEKGRLFDHNRLDDDLAHYQANSRNQWRVEEAPAICGAKPQAFLQFHAAWQQQQHGAILAGGELVVDYSLYRLSQCHNDRYMGQPTWNTIAYARFLPSNEIQQAALLDGVDASGAYRAKLARFSVPQGAQSVELWFSTSGRSCATAWDSNFGQNYRFAIQAQAPAPVKWAGDWGNALSRACDYRAGVPEPILVDSYQLTRGCHRIFADVYTPALTDAPALQPHLIQAQAIYQRDGGELRTAWLQFVERVGNNYRFVWRFPAAEMIHEGAWQQYRYAFRFSTDGVTWFQIAQEDGALRTLQSAP